MVKQKESETFEQQVIKRLDQIDKRIEELNNNVEHVAAQLASLSSSFQTLQMKLDNDY